MTIMTSSGVAARPRIDHCLVLANPAAGSVTPQLVDQVAERCAAHCRVVKVEFTAHVGGAAEIIAATAALASPPDLVVAVGGDGTVREAAEGLARALGHWPAGATGGQSGSEPPTRPALLAVPAGTGNSSHRAVWGDVSWEQVLAAALSGRDPVRIRQLDLMRVVATDRAVLLGASAGFIAAVTETASSLAHVPGRARYLQAMATVFATFRPYQGQVLVDGEPLYEGSTTMVTVGGARHRVGTFQVLPRSVLDDGELDVCVLRGDLTDDERAELAQHVMAGTHLGHAGVYYARGRQVTIGRGDGEPLCFEHDGEVWSGPEHTLTLQVVPHAVPMLAPATPVAG
jgi:diacylglycerol kinase (ATP)